MTNHDKAARPCSIITKRGSSRIPGNLMTYARLAVLALLAPLLSACFTVDQTLRVASDTDAVLEVRAALPAAVAAMAEAKYAKGKPFCADKGATEKHGLTVTVESRIEGDNQVCVMKAQGTLAQIAKTAADKAMLPPDATDQAKALTYALEQQSPGVWKLSMTLTPPPEFIAFAGSDDMKVAAQAMIFGDVKGRGLSWAITADEIVESSGTVSADRTRAEFAIPLGDMLTKPQPSYSFVTTFRTKP
jgi:hypothetical protein